MKPLLCSITLSLLFTPVFADDLLAPKPDPGHTIRVLLHLSGSERLIDYSDVYKLYSCDPQFIAFETNDGFIVTHHGAYTLIIQKNATETARPALKGLRFFDPK